MAQYRKKPVVIEAYKYQAELGNNRLMNWLAQHKVNISDWSFHDGEVVIATLEGNMKVSDGDFIIIGVKGEVYPCKPDIFEATYEEIDSTSVPQSRDEECAEILQNGMQTHYTGK